MSRRIIRGDDTELEFADILVHLKFLHLKVDLKLQR